MILDLDVSLAHAPATRGVHSARAADMRAIVVRQPSPLALQREGAEHAQKNTSGKSFLQNEGGCRDGINYEKGYQQEDASADNKNHTSIPTSFFLLLCIKNVWLLVIKHVRCIIHNIIITVEVSERKM